MMRTSIPASICALVLVGCGSDAPLACPDGSQPVGDSCAIGCPPTSFALPDGSCVAVGLGACPTGFLVTEAGCLPERASDCPPGTMALIGETSCRAVMTCGAGPWGDVEPGPTPQYVAAAFVGDSDGSAERPWTSIGAAVAAASPGAVVVVGAGSYHESITVTGKAVDIRGVCPEAVHIVGAAQTPPAVAVVDAEASGSRLSGVSITGPSAGFATSGAVDVHLERVWVHDTGNIGVDAEDPLGETALVVSDSLIEGSAGSAAIFASGASLVVERTVIRNTAASTRGIASQTSASRRGDLQLRDAVLVGIGEIGVAVVGGDAIIDRTLVDGAGLGAINIKNDAASGERSLVAITDAALINALHAGISVFGAEVSVETTTIAHIFATNADDGRGINVQDDITGDPGLVSVARSSLFDLDRIGMFVAGGDVELRQTRIQTRATADDGGGRALVLQPGPETQLRSNATVYESALELASGFGVMVGESNLSLERSLVRDVGPEDGPFGDAAFGDCVAALPTATVSIQATRLAQAARAGLSLFGATGSLGASELSCVPIDIAVQDLAGSQAMLSDDGGNRCVCDGSEHVCSATATDIEPPSAR